MSRWTFSDEQREAIAGMTNKAILKAMEYGADHKASCVTKTNEGCTCGFAETFVVSGGADLYLQIMTFKQKQQPVLLWVADKLDPDYIRRDYELGEPEPAPLANPDSQLLTVNFQQVEERVIAALLAGNHLVILDKLMNNVALTEDEQKIVDGLSGSQ